MPASDDFRDRSEGRKLRLAPPVRDCAVTATGIPASCELRHPVGSAPHRAGVERGGPRGSGRAMPGSESGIGQSSALPVTDLDTQFAALSTMDHTELRAEWRRLYRSHPPKKVRRDVLELGVAFKLQERVLGGLGASTRRRLTELTGTTAGKGKLAAARTIRPRAGAKLMREWGGITHEITVLEDGFTWNGERWRSLSAIAKTTGAGRRPAEPHPHGSGPAEAHRRRDEAADPIIRHQNPAGAGPRHAGAAGSGPALQRDDPARGR